MGTWLYNWWRRGASKYVVGVNDAAEERLFRLAGKTPLLPIAIPTEFELPPPVHEHQTFPAITDEMVREYVLRREAVKPNVPPKPETTPEPKPVPVPETVAEPRPKPEQRPTEYHPDEVVMAQWFPQVWFYSAKIIGRREDKYYIEFLHCFEKMYVKARQVVPVDFQIGDFVGVWPGEQARYGFVKDVNREYKEYLVEFQHDERHDPPILDPAWVNIKEIFADLWELPPRYRPDG